MEWICIDDHCGSTLLWHFFCEQSACVFAYLGGVFFLLFYFLHIHFCSYFNDAFATNFVHTWNCICVSACVWVCACVFAQFISEHRSVFGGANTTIWVAGGDKRREFLLLMLIHLWRQQIFLFKTLCVWVERDNRRVSFSFVCFI